jgi:hypothetical protein
MKDLGARLMRYEPNWKGPITPEDSIGKILSLIGKAEIDDGNAGDMISHLGSKQWI